MKIVFLNVCHGEMGENLINFMREQSLDTDIFCLEEANKGPGLFCEGLLPKHQFVIVGKILRDGSNFFQAMCVRKEFQIIGSETLLEENPDMGLGLYAHIRDGSRDAHILNIHGVPQPGTKLDNPDRLEQSSDIISFLKNKRGPVIVGGDFNLLPETKSVQMFSEHGYRNLIEDFAIPMTRNEIAWKKFGGERQYFADYVFVNSGVDVKKFSVPHLLVSDHLPLILEIA